MNIPCPCCEGLCRHDHIHPQDGHAYEWCEACGRTGKVIACPICKGEGESAIIGRAVFAICMSCCRTGVNDPDYQSCDERNRENKIRKEEAS